MKKLLARKSNDMVIINPDHIQRLERHGKSQSFIVMIDTALIVDETLEDLCKQINERS